MTFAARVGPSAVPWPTASAGHGHRRQLPVVAGGVALALAALTGVATSAYALLVQQQPIGEPALGWVAELTFVVVGVVVTLARPANRVGWVILGGGAAMALGDAGVDVADWGLVNHPGAVAGAGAFAVVGAGIRTIGWFAITLLLPTWFPDGRALPGRWRHLPHLVGVTMALGVIGTVFATHAQLNELSHWHNPLSSHVLNAVADPASGLSLLLAVVCLVIAVAQLVSRFRRSDAVVRRQIGLYAAAATLPVVAAPLGVLGIAGGWVFYATTIPLPICVGIAVVGRGLYDLPTAANKALVWATLSISVVAIYALVLGVVGSLLDGGGRWLPWLAAAVVAVSITPLRDALQGTINRVTYGRWEDPYRVLADLGQRLEASADVDLLLQEVTSELSSTLGLTDVAVLDASGRVLAGESTPGASRMPLVAYGRSVGTLAYRSSEALRAADVTLLHDLAAHLGGLLHAHRLAADLQRARERLVLAREEERRRLRRDLHDGLGPALAGHLLRLEVAAAELAPGSPVRSQLDDLRGEVRGTVEDVRRVVEGLRPPALDEIGLGAALGQAIGRLTSGTPTGRTDAAAGSAAPGLRAEVVIGNLPPLTAAVEVAAYRITTEAVTNVVRHAAARTCRISLAMDGPDLRLEVADDGRGLRRRERQGHGLETMRERAEELGGTLVIAPTVAGDGRGTVVTATLPTADADAPASRATGQRTGTRTAWRP